METIILSFVARAAEASVWPWQEAQVDQPCWRYRAFLSFQRGVAGNSLACELEPLPALGQQFKPSLCWELADGCYLLMPYSASYEINSALVLGLGHNNHPERSGANLVLFPPVGRLVGPLEYG